MVRACCMHDHKLTVRHAHLKLIDQPPTKVRRLIPFPVLLLYRTSWTTCSKLPYYVSVFPGLFHSLSPTYALYCTLPKFFALFVPLFCRLLPYEGTLMLPPFEMLVRSPVLLLLPYAQGSWWPKLSEYVHLFLYVTRMVYAGQMCAVLLTPFAYLVQCLKRVSFFRLSFLFFLHIFPLPTYKRCRRCSNSSILLLDGLFSR